MRPRALAPGAALLLAGAGAALVAFTIAVAAFARGLSVTWTTLALGLVALAVCGLVFRRALHAERRHASELAARRALQGAMDKLAGSDNEEAIVHAFRDACREAFQLRELQIHLASPGRPPRTWDVRLGRGSGRPARLRIPLASAQGEQRGVLTLVVEDRGRARLAEDHEIATVFAGYLSVAIGQAEALRQLAAAKERISDVFEAAPDPIVVVGRGGALVQRNLAARAAFGDIVPAIDEKGNATSADGRLFEFAASRVALEGGGYGAILLGRDVTERARAEERLRRSERLSALGTLVAGVAHEVNNPLMYLQGHLEIALSELDAPEPDRALVRDAIGTALKGARRIEFISKGLRATLRAEPAHREEFSVNRVVEEAAELLRGGLPANVALVVDLDPADPVVQGDPHEIHQVVVNLAKNAVEAIGTKGGCVTLVTRTPGGRAEVVVRDDGPGLSAEARGKLFTPFFTTKSEGTGLGLAITHSLVDAHGGELSVESEPGAGATFRVSLPRAPPTPRAT